MYACVKFICICKLFTSVYAFITNIRCIGMDFILVCTCISYIYFEHPIVYMYMWVIYRCICTCFMYVLISEVWFKSYMAPHILQMHWAAVLAHPEPCGKNRKVRFCSANRATPSPYIFGHWHNCHNFGSVCHQNRIKNKIKCLGITTILYTVPPFSGAQM